MVFSITFSAAIQKWQRIKFASEWCRHQLSYLTMCLCGHVKVLSLCVCGYNSITLIMFWSQWSLEVLTEAALFHF